MLRDTLIFELLCYHIQLLAMQAVYHFRLALHIMHLSAR